MDILKIRKKAQAAKASAQEAARREGEPSAPAATSAEAPSPPANQPEEAPAARPAAPSAPQTRAEDEEESQALTAAALEQGAPALGEAKVEKKAVSAPPMRKEVEPLSPAARPDESEQPPDGAPSATESPSASADELAAKFSRSRLDLRDDDPLGEFLAYYDEKSDRLDVVDTNFRDESGRRFLAFQLANEAYAVSILDIREILKTYAVTRVPRAAASVLGVLSKRGVVMPVIDLAAALGLRGVKAKMRPEQRILVVGDGEEVVGLRVDSVRSVVRIAADDVENVPGGLGPRSAHLLSGLGRSGDELHILLDVVAFLGHLYGTVDLDVASNRPESSTVKARE